MKPFRIVEKKNLWFLISVAVILLGVGNSFSNALNQKPVLNFGIDFTGGTTMLLKFDALTERYSNRSSDKTVSDVNIRFIENMRHILKSFGLEKSNIQITNDQEIIIHTQFLDNSRRLAIQSQLQEKLGHMELLEVDIIGPTIGQELKETSVWIIVLVSIALLLYITWRFDLAFGLAALIATIHDGIITLSLASLLNIEINTAFVAAILTILGYSINDTIVVFDRIRENLVHVKDSQTIHPLVNKSIYQTLFRTINTSLTTLFVIVCLFVFGGTTIKGFALVLLIGILAGTYSSVFIASPVFTMLYTKLKKVD